MSRPVGILYSEKSKDAISTPNEDETVLDRTITFASRRGFTAGQ